MSRPKRAKDEVQMLVLKSRHRAILIVILAVVAATVLAWFARTDLAINYLPHNRDADWIVFPTAAE